MSIYYYVWFSYLRIELIICDFVFSDVDTPEPDEKSLITYISSLYDVFPEPPAIHPLYDEKAQYQLDEYKDLAKSLQNWMDEKTTVLSNVYFLPTLIEMKKLYNENMKIKNEEMI